jgi:methylenetetrahydrofolate dehydrogenase (NADP+) / methenyltetrahydrofolate cyclohydrolase
MIIDGRQIAEEILAKTKEQVSMLPRPPRLIAFTCAPTFETRRYLALKKRKAAAAGIEVTVKELPETSSTEDVLSLMSEQAKEADAIVVQLPFPPHVDIQKILEAIPPEKDPDGFFYEQTDTASIPPVAGAVQEIALRHNVDFSQKNVVVLGHGRLVGQPVSKMLRKAGANVTVLTEHDGDSRPHLQGADIIVSGIGKPHYITKDMVHEGVVVFDAGTSEDGGLMVGDVNPEVAEKASLFTPVPGGIGPVTVAVLLRNVVDLVRQ